MHNWLLEVDGLDDEWEQGKSSIWQGELGEFEEDDDATQHAFRCAGFGLGHHFVTMICQLWKWATMSEPDRMAKAAWDSMPETVCS